METIKLKCRSWFKGSLPKQIKLEIPGWAGEPNNHESGDKPQPWHCPPFVEGSTYGLELYYPFDTECHVKNVNGKIVFEGDFTQENQQCHGVTLPPFVAFSDNHFGMTSALDIRVPEDYVLRTEPHPRFYTDTTNTVPCCVPGHIQTSWWPKIFFVVFKSPNIGQTIIFKKDQPFGQILILPKKVTYEIQEMDQEEIYERGLLDSILEKNISKIAKNRWRDSKGYSFSDKYKQLSTLVAKEGYQKMKEYLHGLYLLGKNKKITVYKNKIKFKKKSDENIQDK